MDYKEKLQLIQKITGQNQDDLAYKLSVTFAALNRWLNNKAIPREHIRKKIDKLYMEITDEKDLSEDPVLAKKEVVFLKRKKHKNVLKKIAKNPDIRDEFYLALTYNSSSIEGSTLSVNETAAILFHNKTFPSKSAVEHLEAKNHQAALEYLLGHVNSKSQIDEKLILKLHSILLNGIHSDAGFYRRHAVRIVGSNVPCANYVKVPTLMGNLAKEINSKTKDFIEKLAITHSKFEQIHSFGDGNGRVGRLILNAMLLKEDFPPAVIKQKEKHKYYTCLNKAQTKEDFKPLEDFIVDSIFDGYRILERIQ